MIQVGSTLNVIDNCGAKKVSCIKVIKNFKKRYSFLGDIILVSVKKLRKRRRALSKVKKGEIYKALIVRLKTKSFATNKDAFSCVENSVVLFNKQNKLIGTRIFGSIVTFFRYTRYMRLIFMSNGLSI